MSTVGKVLVVMQIAFSVLLMGFAGGVYSVQTNWKKKAGEAETKLTKAETDARNAKANAKTIQDKAVASEKALKDAADRAQGTADAEKVQITQIQRQLTQTRTELANIACRSRDRRSGSPRPPRRSRQPAEDQRPAPSEPRRTHHAEPRTCRQNRQPRAAKQGDDREAQQAAQRLRHPAKVHPHQGIRFRSARIGRTGRTGPRSFTALCSIPERGAATAASWWKSAWAAMSDWRKGTSSTFIGGRERQIPGQNPPRHGRLPHGRRRCDSVVQKRGNSARRQCHHEALRKIGPR